MTTLVERGARPEIAPQRYAARIDALRDLLRDAGAAGLLAGPGAELRYLAGYDAMALERVTMLVVPADGDPTLVVPRLERAPAERAPAVRGGAVVVRTWEETEDPYALLAAALPAAHGGAMHTVYVSERLWAMFVLRLAAALPAARLALAGDVLRSLRTHKDADEVELLRSAAHAADRVVVAVAHGRLLGRSEADVAREVVERLLDEGHDSAEHSQIVASGPNAASPHHGASERHIRAGEPVVIDIGGTLGGYVSDMTRTIWVAGDDGTAPDPEFITIYDTVRDAYEAAVAAVRPGVACASIDAVARDVITGAGYGPHFVHRTGHGIGLEVHEEPYIVRGNDRPLEPGNAFSIEPGIYLEGRYGVRLEDIVVCTPDGADVLDEAPRELAVVSG